MHRQHTKRKKPKILFILTKEQAKKVTLKGKNYGGGLCVCPVCSSCMQCVCWGDGPCW